ncbi:hypothetical protein LTR01_009176 [Friedmanniomyces endolithicus]|nr:hypothetical protein LTR01_009176 [Friedmanniomyces endolithicus]KAK0822589.1 hypothetical protein LTR73_009199 [Friedmanniomyces endolithicus]
MEADAQELSRLSQYFTSSRSNGSQDYRRRQAAKKVFGTAELLEQVLSSDLTVRDLLNAMQVSRSFRDGILGSPQLLRSMGLILDSADDIYSGFARLGLFNEFYSFRTSLLPPLHDATIKLVAFFEEDGTVRVHVLFYGNTIRREDDCVAGRQRRTLASVNSKLWSLDVNYYIKAKKDGFGRADHG